MSLSITLADANILISRTLRDYFVYTAKLGALDIHWSETILDEAARNLIRKFGFTAEAADVLIERLLRLAADCPGLLREAHRLGVDSRPQSSEQVLATLERITSKEVAAAVRAVVSAEPASTD